MERNNQWEETWLISVTLYSSVVLLPNKYTLANLAAHELQPHITFF